MIPILFNYQKSANDFQKRYDPEKKVVFCISNGAVLCGIGLDFPLLCVDCFPDLLYLQDLEIKKNKRQHTSIIFFHNNEQLEEYLKTQ
jgi:hypothetical protein